MPKIVKINASMLMLTRNSVPLHNRQHAYIHTDPSREREGDGKGGEGRKCEWREGEEE